MGRKLPKTKRHKKLKFVDPDYKGPPPRSKGKKLLPNEPPTAEQMKQQETSRYMEEFIDMKNKFKQNKPKKRKKKKKIVKDDFIVVKNDIVDFEEPGTKKRLPAVVKQKRFESKSQFFGRLQNMADMAMAEAKMEEKYNIQLVNVDNKGNAEYVTATKEVTENKREKRKKFKERQEEKKRMKKDDKEFDLKKEKIQFGEVASAPPVLTARPRKAPELNKAGKRQLVLKEFLSPSSQSSDKKPVLSTKWKSMPPYKRKMMEDERLRAVNMYRMLKNKNT